MEEEDRILSACPRIHHDAADGKVAAGVSADQALGISVEAAEITAVVEEPDDIGRFGVVRPFRVQVAGEASWVVAQPGFWARRGKGDGA